MVFPGEARIETVGNPASRIFMLTYGAGPRDTRVFFWMQEPDAAGDASRLEAANAAIVARAEPFEKPQAASDQAEQQKGEQQQQLLLQRQEEEEKQRQQQQKEEKQRQQQQQQRQQQQQQQQQQQHAAQQALAAPGPSLVDPGALARILAGIAGAPGAPRAPEREPLSLGDVLEPERAAPLLARPDVREALAPFLPESQRTEAAMRDTLASPQLAQTLAAFTAALQSGQVDTRQFGVDVDGFGVEAFLDAIVRAAERKADGEQ